MRRWLPHPLLTVLLLVLWLLLQQSLAPGTVVVGIVLAVACARLWRRLQLPTVQVRRPLLLFGLGARVLSDLVRSNFAVAAIIALRRPHNSGFVRIPLDTDHPWVLAGMACIISATPGTIWVSHDTRYRVLTLHVLDLVDQATWVQRIKQRYEAPLMKVFG